MLYVAGENRNSQCAKVLLAAIENCETAWANDRAFRDVLFKLDRVEQELEVLCASPGQREARRASGPLPSGQIPKERSEIGG
jgi:hypothetical protein